VELDIGHPVLVPPGGGEVVGNTPDRRVEILSDADPLHATWSRFGPHTEGADLHIHRRHTDLFYVLEGELTIGLGLDGASVVVPAAKLVRVPPLVVHGFSNGSDADVRYLNLHAPGRSFAEFMRALRDGRTFTYDQEPPPADGCRPPTDAVVGGDGVVAEGPGSRVALLADVEEIGMSEVWSDPRSPSPPSHLHDRAVESLYVLEGEMSFTVGEREFRAQAGSWVQVPAGVVHTFAFPGTERVRYLNMRTPNCGYGDSVRAFGHEPPA
jgi:mannose-6-phosphate isomerase-like protein (cupin superfamily)